MLACTFLGTCSLLIIFRIYRGMNPRLTVSTFMSSSDKRVVEEFKRNLTLAWAQPPFLVVLGGSGRCVHPSLKDMRPKGCEGSLIAPSAATQKLQGLPCSVRAPQAGRSSRKQKALRLGPLKGTRARGPRGGHCCQQVYSPEPAPRS